MASAPILVTSAPGALPLLMSVQVVGVLAAFIVCQQWPMWPPPIVTQASAAFAGLNVTPVIHSLGGLKVFSVGLALGCGRLPVMFIQVVVLGIVPAALVLMYTAPRALPVITGPVTPAGPTLMAVRTSCLCVKLVYPVVRSGLM